MWSHAEFCTPAFVQRFLARDREAFFQLYECFFDGAIKLACYALGNSHDAEEAVGDALQELWRKGESYDARKGTIEKFFRGCCLWPCIRQIRTRRRKEPCYSVLGLDVSEVTAGGSDEPVDTQEPSAIDNLALRHFLASCTPAEKLIAEAKCLNLSKKEINALLQEEMGKSREAVRQMSSRFNKKLRHLVKSQCPDLFARLEAQDD